MSIDSTRRREDRKIQIWCEQAHFPDSVLVNSFESNRYVWLLTDGGRRGFHKWPGWSIFAGTCRRLKRKRSTKVMEGMVLKHDTGRIKRRPKPKQQDEREGTWNSGKQNNAHNYPNHSTYAGGAGILGGSDDRGSWSAPLSRCTRPAFSPLIFSSLPLPSVDAPPVDDPTTNKPRVLSVPAPENEPSLNFAFHNLQHVPVIL